MKNLSVLLFSLFLVTSAQVSAQTSITLNGTIDQGPDHVGDSVSWTIITSGNPLVSFGNSVTNANFYDESLSIDHDSFSRVRGTGVTGTWTRPSANDDAPYSYLKIYSNTPGLSIRGRLSSDSGEGIGLSIFGNSVNSLDFYAITDSPAVLGINFAGLDSYANAFDGLAGTYSALQDQISYWQQKVIWNSATGANYTAIIQTIKIENAAVPEPSTYGLCLGVLALLSVVILRRRKI